MNDQSQMMMSRGGFGIWPPPPLPAAVDDPMAFQTPRVSFAAGAGGGAAKPGRINWKERKAADKRKKAAAAAAAAAAGGAAPGYNPPTLKELQQQNRAKARRFYPKKKFARFAPYAPRNTTSFIIRAKKSGGIASLVSPCPVTPAILPTPKFSPSREGLVDMAKEEWGVDGYGSMKGLIRLRSPSGAGMEMVPGGEEDEVDDSSSESDVEEHVEVERRLDHDLSRFKMVYPSHGDEQGAAYLLENRVDDHDTHIAQLEEENLTLKERLFLMEQEMGDLRNRMLNLETEFRRGNNNNNGGDDNHSNSNNGGDENKNLEDASENDGGGDVCSEKSVGDCGESNNIEAEAEAGTSARSE